MSKGIAIIGIGCRYPDASNPKEFWENILAQRQAFRQVPPERWRLEDYFSSDRNDPDKTYSAKAALITGFEFDRVRYRIAGSTFRATDIAQWLALETAAEALKDAGYEDGSKLPRDTTGAIVGNTLAGEVSRANVLRLRWPYVKKVLEETLEKLGLPSEQRQIILKEAEKRYKLPFPAINHENLAGGLSNTIAGRICNHFDFHGGGYSVDGACAASLLAVTTACAALESGDMDFAIAGGVDISLDPFEIIGFAKMGALAEKEMRVYDQRSAGFLPGEGCGMMVLRRLENALADHNRIYAVIRGWGISSDGQGGLTTPSVNGQALAIERAYRRAGYRLNSVAFIEGHGTGTTVGDKVELLGLAAVLQNDALNEAAKTDERAERLEVSQPRVGIGSVKANIGHTKAAAGIAGLIKSALALHAQVLPAAPGCERPHPEFGAGAQGLYPLRRPQVWKEKRALRAGVSAMGFGGINTHITLESLAALRQAEFSSEEKRLAATSQDSEIFFFAAKRNDELKTLVERVQSFAFRISQAEMADLAAELASQVSPGEVLAAIVASSPEELHQKLGHLTKILASCGAAQKFSHLDSREGVFLARGMTVSRIGFLYPGQGTQQFNMTSHWFERYDFVRSSFELADSLAGDFEGEKLSRLIFRNIDRGTTEQKEKWQHWLAQTEAAQPAIAAASVAVTKVLSHLGVSPSLVIGYSLGEWPALWSAGVISEKDLYRCVAARGRAMAAGGQVKGGMATVAASIEEVEKLLAELPGYVVIAGYNSPKQVVVSGELEAIRNLVKAGREKGIAAIALKVSNAFHSRLVAHSAAILRRELEKVAFSKSEFPVISTVTAQEVQVNQLKERLCEQILLPVRFLDAVKTAERFGVDIFVEVGPGRSLGGMVSDIGPAARHPVLYTDDEGGSSLRSFNATISHLFALGVPIQPRRLFEARFIRPFPLDYHPFFISSPCEMAASSDRSPEAAIERPLGKVSLAPAGLSESAQQVERDKEKPVEEKTNNPSGYRSVLKTVLDLAAEITEYPRELIKPENLLLRDLNLNSIASAQLVTQAARRLGLPRPSDPTEYATVSLQQVATMLYEIASTKSGIELLRADEIPSGISSWVRSFVVEMKEEPLPSHSPALFKPGQRYLLLSEEKSPVALALQERLSELGVEVEPRFWNFPERFPEDLFAEEKSLAGCILVLPHGVTSDVWDEDPSTLSKRLQRVSGPVFSFGKSFARWYLQTKPKDVLVGVVQFGGGEFGRTGNAPPQVDLACAAGFLKSLFLELNLPAACVVDLPPEAKPDDAARRAVDEFQHATDYVEAGYTKDGTRRVPVMKLMQETPALLPVLNQSDVLLVTGGGRGIAPECALAIARQTGCKVVLLGRTALTDGESPSAAEEELRLTLKRFKESGIFCRYQVCDISDASSAAMAVGKTEAEMGPITAVLHAAGSNIPQAAHQLTNAVVEPVLAPKIKGTVNLLRALDRQRLKAFIAFGSIIAQTGMRGETAYAFANEWMNLALLRFQAAFPAIRCLSLNWSVWSGLGMGERLGSVEALVREGITPIEPAQGVAELLDLLKSKTPTPEILVTGRLGEVPTRTFAEEPLPLLRFLERKRVYYPGVELICECELSADSDPYLKDHLFQGMQLFPAVFGIEAMLQAASALTQNKPCAAIEKLEFLRPIMVPPGGMTTIQVIAQVLQKDGKTPFVDVAIRSAETKLKVDHFRGRFLFETSKKMKKYPPLSLEGEALQLSPKKDLYGNLLFQGPMFQHLTSYLKLSATSCLATVECQPPPALFGRYFPQTLLLGNPTVRDVFLHGIQPCVPDAVILPLSIERIQFVKDWKGFSGLYLSAVERERGGGEYLYDVSIYSPQGELVEKLEGFRCRAVGKKKLSSGKGDAASLPAPLLAPYLERTLQSIYPQAHCSVALAFAQENGVTPDGNRLEARRQISRKALALAVENLVRPLAGESRSLDNLEITHNGDGRPEVYFSGKLKSLASKLNLSASHLQDITLAVAGMGACACDMEAVHPRSQPEWEDLLGPEGMNLAEAISQETKEPPDASRTRVWTMIECLKKASLSRLTLPVLEKTFSEGWITARIQQEEVGLASFRVRLVSKETEAIVTLLVTRAPSIEMFAIGRPSLK